MINQKTLNLHIHTYNSDGVHAPWYILQRAKKMGLGVLSITDHNEIRGSLVGYKIAQRLGIIFFPGIECMFLVNNRVYELLAYFYEPNDLISFYSEYRYSNGFTPSFKNVAEVVQLIRKYNGAVVAAHPFGRKGVFRKLRNRGMNVDAIEEVNAFTGEKRNRKAKAHQDSDHEFLRLGAADMHFFVSDLAKVYTRLESETEITKRDIWDNLLGKKRNIKFIPVGKNFRPHKIFFQKPLCTLVYTLNYPRLHLSYWLGKFNKRGDL